METLIPTLASVLAAIAALALVLQSRDLRRINAELLRVNKELTAELNVRTVSGKAV